MHGGADAGYSDGGILGLMLAVRYPQLVRLALLSKIEQPVPVISADRDAITLEQRSRIGDAH